jgi:transcriptional regulator with XRE-family HTH domain
MDPGRKVMNLRLDRGLTAQELGRAVGVSPSAISKLERGLGIPTAGILVRIARVLCVSCEYLLDDSLPYSYKPPECPRGGKGRTRMEVSREEKAFLTALRRARPAVREIAREFLSAPLWVHCLAHQAVFRAGGGEASASHGPQSSPMRREGH